MPVPDSAFIEFFEESTSHIKAFLSIHARGRDKPLPNGITLKKHHLRASFWANNAYFNVGSDWPMEAVNTSET